MFRDFLVSTVLSAFLLWGCRSTPSVSPKASYLSVPPVAIDAEKIQVVEQESLVGTWNTLLDVNLVDLVRQWTKSGFSCSGFGPSINVEIVEAKLAPSRELSEDKAQEDENIYVGMLSVRIFLGNNPLLAKQSHTVHSKVSVTIPAHYTLKERRQMVLSLAEEVVETLHKEVIRYLSDQKKVKNNIF
ncbi:hypothetical protein P618_201083 [Holospora obtusa F1]|uniref:Uncharacterized protein n=1 Tax=Holospora obtusa F1 TaxID=1399147 RepID=W6TDG1_HOLOB|nr:hypothetical protein [Holospora obtusa]ETZ06791.1 hypothetical protein P618_201083 [Holospora obtusa F1]